MVAASRSLVALLALLLAACGEAPPDIAGTMAGMPGAEGLAGVRLGMSLAQLRRARPALLDERGDVHESFGDFVVGYQIDSGDRDSIVVAAGVRADVPSRDALAAAWNAALVTNDARFGPRRSCTVVAWPGSTLDHATRLALWRGRGGVVVSTTAQSNHRTLRALGTAGTPASARTHGGGASFEWNVYQSSVLAQSFGALYDAFSWRSGSGACRLVRLDAPAGGPPRAIMLRDGPAGAAGRSARPDSRPAPHP